MAFIPKYILILAISIIDCFKKYYEYSDYFEKLAQKNGLEYIDFNKINKEKEFVPTNFLWIQGI